MVVFNVFVCSQKCEFCLWYFTHEKEWSICLSLWFLQRVIQVITITIPLKYVFYQEIQWTKDECLNKIWLYVGWEKIKNLASHHYYRIHNLKITSRTSILTTLPHSRIIYLTIYLTYTKFTEMKRICVLKAV